MHLEFLKLTSQERSLYFEQAAQRRDLSPVIIEKDFWVSWMLSVLFESPFANDLVFKGGTSLSKVFGVIDRFSEDIDLSLSPEFLKLPEAGTTRNQANKWMEKAEAACAKSVRDQLHPNLEAAVASVLGKSKSNWLEFQTDATTNSPVLIFRYPTTHPAGFEYLPRSVKLEFGTLTDQRPAGRHLVTPWLAEAIPQAFSDWHCEVVALEIERTFWEKATILHVEYFRPPDKLSPSRFSRHYADTAALSIHAAAESALGMLDLMRQVVDWKQQFFGSGWARYDLAKPGTFRLVPPEHRIPELQIDYRAMRDMYLNAPVAFDIILQRLHELETRINQFA